MIIYILFILEIKALSLIIYAKYQIAYVDDYIDYIISSEGIIQLLNQTKKLHSTYYFKDVKHDLIKSLCIQIINYAYEGHFAFKYASINEYDITIINYENYYYCDNCNLNTTKKFNISDQKYNGSSIIDISYYNEKGPLHNNTLCLNPTSDISIFYIDESKINQQFYIGKTVKYTLANEFDYFNINNTFIINKNVNYIFDLNTVSFKIVKITNKKGKIFNDEEELFEGSFFNAKNNYLIYKGIDNETEKGYLMIIDIETKPRNQKSVNISTCEKEAKIYLYIAQKNCTMNEIK